jgi:hypothetical protein
MWSGDNLTVFAFLVGSAIAFGIPAVEQPGWTIKRWIYGSAAILFVLAALLWRWIPSVSPVAYGWIVELTHSPSGWFTLLMTLFIVSILPFRRKKSVEVPADQSIVEISATQKQVTRSTNWSIWKLMPKYRISDLAAILAKDDPVDLRVSHNQAAYLKFINSEIENRKLEYIKEKETNNYTGNTYYKAVDAHTYILRDVALKWAQERQLDLAHIK